MVLSENIVRALLWCRGRRIAVIPPADGGFTDPAVSEETGLGAVVPLSLGRGR